MLEELLKLKGIKTLTKTELKFVTGSVRVRCGCKKSITSWVGDYPDRASLNRAVARNCPHGAFCHTNPEFEDGGAS